MTVQKTDQKTDHLLTTEELAQAAGVGLSCIHKWRCQHLLPVAFYKHPGAGRTGYFFAKETIPIARRLREKEHRPTDRFRQIATKATELATSEFPTWHPAHRAYTPEEVQIIARTIGQISTERMLAREEAGLFNWKRPAKK